MVGVDPLTRAVLFLSSADGAARSLSSAAFSPKYFPRTLGACMALSGAAGYLWMNGVQMRRLERQEAVYQAAWKTGRGMTRRMTATIQSPTNMNQVPLRNHY